MSTPHALFIYTTPPARIYIHIYTFYQNIPWYGTMFFFFLLFLLLFRFPLLLLPLGKAENDSHAGLVGHPLFAPFDASRRHIKGQNILYIKLLEWERDRTTRIDFNDALALPSKGFIRSSIRNGKDWYKSAKNNIIRLIFKELIWKLNDGKILSINVQAFFSLFSMNNILLVNTSGVWINK